MNLPTTKSIRVHVLNREVTLRVRPGREEATAQLAQQLNAQLRAFLDAHPDQSETMAAIITALMLAEETHALRQRLAEQDAHVAQAADTLSDVLAEVLDAA